MEKDTKKAIANIIWINHLISNYKKNIKEIINYIKIAPVEELVKKTKHVFHSKKSEGEEKPETISWYLEYKNSISLFNLEKYNRGEIIEWSKEASPYARHNKKRLKNLWECLEKIAVDSEGSDDELIEKFDELVAEKHREKEKSKKTTASKKKTTEK